MTLRFIYAVILNLLLFSCSPSTESDHSQETTLTTEQQMVEDLQKKVLVTHDDVMPLMGTLVALKLQLEEKNDGLKSSDDPGAQDAVIINEMLITNLDQAHEGMMSWMRNFQQVDPQEDVATNLKYLEEEKSKISYIQDQITSAINAAQEALDRSEVSD